MQTPSTAAIQALQRRATLGSEIAAGAHAKSFWRGYAKALKDLDHGTGDTLAAKDAALQQRALSAFVQASARGCI